MSVYDVLQLIGGLILAFGYIPQIIQIIRTKTCANLSLKTFVSMTVGISLMEIYAIHLALCESGGMFLATNSISLFMALLICVPILAVRKK